jgi:hypothetical protein
MPLPLVINLREEKYEEDGEGKNQSTLFSYPTNSTFFIKLSLVVRDM